MVVPKAARALCLLPVIGTHAFVSREVCRSGRRPRPRPRPCPLDVCGIPALYRLGSREFGSLVGPSTPLTAPAPGVASSIGRRRRPASREYRPDRRAPAPPLRGHESTEATDPSELPGEGTEEILRRARTDLVEGARTANERFIPTAAATLRAVLPAAFLAAGAAPFGAYLLSPARGAAMSRGVAVSVLALERAVHDALARPTLLVFGFLANLLAVALLTFAVFVLGQLIVLKDVWNGTANLLTSLVGMREMLQKSETPSFPNPREVAAAIEPLSSTGSLVAKEVEDPFGLFTLLVYMPIMEEILFRGLFYAGCKWIVNLSQNQRTTDDLVASKTSDAESDAVSGQDEPTTWPAFPTGAQNLPAFLTSILFAAVHIFNEAGRLRGLLANADALSAVQFMQQVFVFTTMVMASVSATFMASQTILIPVFESNGIVGSVGAHIMWNLRTMTLGFYIPYRAVKIITRMVLSRMGWVNNDKKKGK